MERIEVPLLGLLLVTGICGEDEVRTVLAPDGAPDVPALPAVPDVEGWAEGPLVLTEADTGGLLELTCAAGLPVETDAWVPVPVEVDA